MRSLKFTCQDFPVHSRIASWLLENYADENRVSPAPVRALLGPAFGP